VSRPIHPPLVAVHTPLALYAANFSLVSFFDVWIPCLASALVGLALWLAARALTREWQRSAALSSVVMLAIYAFGPFHSWSESAMKPYPSPVQTAVAFVCWSALVLLGAFLALRKWSQLERITALMNVGSVVLVALAAGSVLVAHVQVVSQVGARARTESPDVKRQSASPDVFVIVLDGYAREDVLQRIYGSEPLLADGLRSRGFFVAAEARANYVQTELSLASALNLQPVQTLVSDEGRADVQRALLDRAIDDSAVKRQFEGLGYRTVAVTSGFPALSFSGYDLWVGTDTGGSLYWDALRRKTPFRPSSHAYTGQFEDRRDRIHGAFRQLQKLGKRSGAPKFVFAHVLAPHPPFVFGARGEPLRPRGQYELSDGSHFLQTRSREEYLQGYAGQAAYVAALTLGCVDRILAAQPDAVVVVMSDHGPKSGLDQESAENSDLDECFPILYAVHGPTTVMEKTPDDVTPVNGLGLVLEGLFAREHAAHADRSFFSPWSAPLKLADVTDRLKRPSRRP
jgi:hypothetical protein